MQNRTSSLADFLNTKLDLATAQQLSTNFYNYLPLSGGMMVSQDEMHSAEIVPTKIELRSYDSTIHATVKENAVGVAADKNGMVFNDKSFLTWTADDVSPSVLLSSF